MLGLEGGGQSLEPALRHFGVAQVSGLPQHRLHVLVHVIREVTQDVALLVDLATMDRSQ